MGHVFLAFSSPWDNGPGIRVVDNFLTLALCLDNLPSSFDDLTKYRREQEAPFDVQEAQK
jgi:hypothetical protein